MMANDPSKEVPPPPPASAPIGFSIAEAIANAQRTAAALVAARHGHAAGARTQALNSALGSASSAEGPKISIMAPKAGADFVIPKNKLSGALVPVGKTSSGKWDQIEPKKEEEEPKPPRKTRWGPDLMDDPAVKRGRALAYQTRAEMIAAQLESGNLDLDNEEARSPSPPPIYDSNGQRVNTREGRRRTQLDTERRDAIAESLRLNPAYKPPSGFKPAFKEAKLFIPVKDYPGYNFIGLILGPRGNTQKRMESETGTKITIRGKGAVKEGKMQNLRRDGKELDGAFEDLHVHIMGDTWEKIDAALALVEPLLTPVDELRNTHKMLQLRELAEMNGTIRDIIRACTLCGELGHRDWECPKEKLTSFHANVMCQYCGDGGHPTIDCPVKRSGQGRALDKEYQSFLAELGGNLDGMGGGTSPVVITATGPQAPDPLAGGGGGDPGNSAPFIPRFFGAGRFPIPSLLTPAVALLLARMPFLQGRAPFPRMPAAILQQLRAVGPHGLIAALRQMAPPQPQHQQPQLQPQPHSQPQPQPQPQPDVRPSPLSNVTSAVQDSVMGEPLQHDGQGTAGSQQSTPTVVGASDPSQYAPPPVPGNSAVFQPTLPPSITPIEPSHFHPSSQPSIPTSSSLPAALQPSSHSTVSGEGFPSSSNTPSSNTFPSAPYLGPSMAQATPSWGSSSLQQPSPQMWQPQPQPQQQQSSSYLPISSWNNNTSQGLFSYPPPPSNPPSSTLPPLSSTLDHSPSGFSIAPVPISSTYPTPLPPPSFATLDRMGFRHPPPPPAQMLDNSASGFLTSTPPISSFSQRLYSPAANTPLQGQGASGLYSSGFHNDARPLYTPIGNNPSRFEVDGRSNMPLPPPLYPPLSSSASNAMEGSQMRQSYLHSDMSSLSGQQPPPTAPIWHPPTAFPQSQSISNVGAGGFRYHLPADQATSAGPLDWQRLSNTQNYAAIPQTHNTTVSPYAIGGGSVGTQQNNSAMAFRPEYEPSWARPGPLHGNSTWLEKSQAAAPADSSGSRPLQPSNMEDVDAEYEKLMDSVGVL